MRAMTSQRGNGMIEMLLFAPAALLFLFLVTDAGMALHDRAGVIDAARAALLASSTGVRLSETGDDDGFEPADQRDFLFRAADEILAAVARSRNGAQAASPPFVRVALARVSFNPFSGGIEDVRLERPDAARNPASAGAGACAENSLEGFLEARLRRAEASPSPLALELAPGFASASARYFETRYLLAAQICGLSRGITSNIAAGLLGRFFQFHEEQFQPLRTREGLR